MSDRPERKKRVVKDLGENEMGAGRGGEGEREEMWWCFFFCFHFPRGIEFATGCEKRGGQVKIGQSKHFNFFRPW